MEEWIGAHKSVIEFGEKGYEWSMTHSYFADTGGFVYRNKEGHLKVINALEFLELCEAGKIVNPFITEKDIKDRSKSDAMSNAIFFIQLLWFMLQIVVRHFIKLAVTLVELDTLCMTLLAVFYLLLWWNKPLNAGSPHVFDETQEDKVYSPEELSKAWKSQSSVLYDLIMYIVRVVRRQNNAVLPRWYYVSAFRRSVTEVRRSRWFGSYTHISASRSMSFLCYRRNDANRGFFLPRLARRMFNETIKKIEPEQGSTISVIFAWSVLGALHLAAWNYEFPTQKRALIWRGASLALAASGFVCFVGWLSSVRDSAIEGMVIGITGSVALVSRIILVILMFLSLRALPCSAHQTIPWIQYIPHL